MLKLECSFCKVPLNRTKSQLSVIKIKNIQNIFCGVSCRNKFRVKKVSATCKQCTKIFEKFPSQQRSIKNNDFCGSSCAATYNNRTRMIGKRTSKLERWLHDRLPEVFPGLKFLFNDKQTVEGELDIYIPSLKLAVELNGPTHYFPIYGQDVLDKTKANDAYKRQVCKKNGIKLVELDVSDLMSLKSYKFTKYVNDVFDIVKSDIERETRGETLQFSSVK